MKEQRKKQGKLLRCVKRELSGRRIMSMFLVLCMAFTLFPTAAFAESGGVTVGAGSKAVCENHKEHDLDCGYIEAEEEKPCSHRNEDGSYSCTPVSDGEKDHIATASDADEEYICDHTDGCGCEKEVTGSPCTHRCELCAPENVMLMAEDKPFTMTYDGIETGYDTLKNAWSAAQAVKGADEDNRPVVKMYEDVSGIYFQVKDGNYITLDLNGCTINRKRSSSNRNGFSILVSSGGNFILTDTSSDVLEEQGKIIGGYVSDDSCGGGGIQVQRDGIFTLNGGNITGNKTKYRGGGVGNRGTFIMTGGGITNNTAPQMGAGVYNEGHFTMTGGVISGNASRVSGGGVANFGTFVMEDGEITNNTADADGGGVHSYGAVMTGGSFTMTGGMIKNNRADSGGGILNACTLTVTGGEISDNTATWGGGIYSWRREEVGSYVSISGDTTIANNKADNGSGSGSGGGIYFEDGNMTIEDGNILGNTSHWGGGIYAQTTDNRVNADEISNVTISGGKITDNSAGKYGGGLSLCDANLTMTGGQITQNSCDNGGGLYYYGGDGVSCTFTAGGAVDISGNIKAEGGGADNVSLASGNYITLGTDDTAPEEDMQIYVQGAEGDVIVKSNAGEGQERYFYADDAALMVVCDNDQLKLVPKPVVDAVTVSPKTVNVQAGDTVVFTADVAGANNPDRTVNWTVSGSEAAGTGITSDGVLTVAEEETAQALTVQAVSAADPSKSDTAEVTVTQKPVPRYALTVNNGVGGGSYEEGTSITVTADNALKGQRFKEWTASGITLEDTSRSTITIIMPAGDVTLTAVYEPIPADIYTVTLNANGGAVSQTSLTVTAGGTVTLPVPTRSGSYRFDGWFTELSGGSEYTDDTPISGNVTLYAHWTYTGGSSSSGGSSYTPPSSKSVEPVTGSSSAGALVDENGTASITVTDQNISDAMKAARDAAAKKGVIAGDITVVINAAAAVGQEAGNASVNLPKAVQQQIIDNKVVNLTIAFDKPDLAISLNLPAITEINSQANGDVQITVLRVDASEFGTAAQAAMGSRPAYDIKVVYEAGTKSVDSLGSGRVTVEIPYVLREGENAGSIYGVCVAADGTVQYLTDFIYDADRGLLVFGINHFNVYGVGYKTVDNLTDTGGKYLTYIVKRGDTLWKISRRYHCTVEEIAAINGIERPERIDVGMQLNIPQK